MHKHDCKSKGGKMKLLTSGVFASHCSVSNIVLKLFRMQKQKKKSLFSRQKTPKAYMIRHHTEFLWLAKGDLQLIHKIL